MFPKKHANFKMSTKSSLVHSEKSQVLRPMSCVWTSAAGKRLLIHLPSPSAESFLLSELLHGQLQGLPCFASVLWKGREIAAGLTLSHCCRSPEGDLSASCVVAASRPHTNCCPLDLGWAFAPSFQGITSIYGFI